MKAKSILAAALVLISSVTFANGSDDSKLVVIRVQESGIFKVIFEGENHVKATVNVLDKTGNLVYSKDIKGENGFILPMNFSGLRPGEYTIEVTDGDNTWTQLVHYARYSEKKSSVRVEKNSSIQNVHISKLKDDGKYLLSIVRTGNDVITISVFNANDELLHTETRKAAGDLAVIYKVKELSGMSKFQITDRFGYSAVIRK